jgi:hypothetical protein
MAQVWWDSVRGLRSARYSGLLSETGWAQPMVDAKAVLWDGRLVHWTAAAWGTAMASG